MIKSTIESEIESFRQIVTLSSSSSDVMAQAEASINKLNALYQNNIDMFSKEDVRYVNSLRGILAQRMSRFEKKSAPSSLKGRRKGDEFTHCWRCETPVDQRFDTICSECSDLKGYKFRICPVCSACGCQRAKKTLV